MFFLFSLFTFKQKSYKREFYIIVVDRKIEYPKKIA